MGLTPLEGLVMGGRTATRPGPPCSTWRVGRHVHRRSTTCSTASPIRRPDRPAGHARRCGDFVDASDRTPDAIDVYVHRCKRSTGAYIAVMGSGVDAITFTAGIGENDRACKAEPVPASGYLGCASTCRGQRRAPEPVTTSTPESSVVITVFPPTTRSLAIARQAVVTPCRPGPFAAGLRRRRSHQSRQGTSGLD